MNTMNQTPTVTRRPDLSDLSHPSVATSLAFANINALLGEGYTVTAATAAEVFLVRRRGLSSASWSYVSVTADGQVKS